MDEGNEDEYHISMLATMPNAREKGRATIIKFLNKKLKNQASVNFLLTVVQDNDAD